MHQTLNLSVKPCTQARQSTVELTPHPPLSMNPTGSPDEKQLSSQTQIILLNDCKYERTLGKGIQYWSQDVSEALKWLGAVQLLIPPIPVLANSSQLSLGERHGAIEDSKKIS